MAAPKIYYARLSQYTLSATGTDSGHPLANLQTYFVADYWKGANTNANQQVAIDFGAARSCNFVVIDGHNFGSMCDTFIALQAADDSGFTTNLVSPTITLDTTTAPYAVTFAAVSRRYWRILFGSTTPLARIPQLGNWFLGTSLDFPYTQEFPFQQGNGLFETSAAKNLQGSKITSQPYGGRKVLSLKFSKFSDAFAVSFRSMHSTVRGSLYPFYYQADDGTLYYVNFARDENPVQTVRYNLNDVNLDMVEQVATLT